MEWSANYVLAEAQTSGIDSLHLCITIPPLIDKIIIRNRWHMKKEIGCNRDSKIPEVTFTFAPKEFS
ncbi:hypothetical protein CKAN_00020500 [Cinnamomum micranthum f. kanehirae]|uniref:Uncharacterized protein n=1 Tax=Cinnamomum micranthum f. kanehirae TaxID=337451 RepID=A0A443N0F0_9MAGN|nr:hypothetical protein CKAN_00020500 [Cinnamomum micranthum f. kanehirae]